MRTDPNLGVRLSDLDRREEALTATEEAVTVYRRLASGNPTAFEPDLARSLNNLGANLSDLGRREEALTATEEAVTIRRRLAAGNRPPSNPTSPGR
jgi:tetratricopeptide (TPR) repeat protein